MGLFGIGNKIDLELLRHTPLFAGFTDGELSDVAKLATREDFAPGDTIKFINQSPNWASVQSNDPDDNYSNYSGNCDAETFAGSSDGWATDWISINGSTTITVTDCMDTTLLPPKVYNHTTYNGYNYGWVEFGNAPNG